MANCLNRIPTLALTVLLASLALPAQAQRFAPDFGDDSGEYAGDGECDDLRFQGETMAEIMLTDEIGRDASDCSAAFSAGLIALNPLFAKPTSDDRIIFGDDASEYAGDGECDDVRFAHDGSVNAIYLAEDIGHDATDCKAGFDAGYLTWQGHLANPERGISAKQLMDAEGDSPFTL
jgi:hypothetical protein